ncbi:restriction endonuclease [Paenibacillus sp. FSL E2-0230]|uniref:restriction endonuclease n=1 Tax=Paenibacillus sp. FSL E2-0230 TaxID=2954727 RepID=UPI0030CA6C05
MILTSKTVDWKDLQRKVAQIFTDINCNARIEESIELIRGEANIDVLVEDTNMSPKLVYLCECKYWDAHIPKHVIHAFRTVVSDSGAHCGYIISKKGFQSGAYDSAIKSNIFLFSWDEFVETYEDRWLNSMIKNLDAIGKPLRDYCNPMSDFYISGLNRLDEDNKKKFEKLCSQYFWFCPYSSKDWYLEIGTGIYKRSEVVSAITYVIDKFFEVDEFNSYDEFFRIMIEICQVGICKLDALLGQEFRRL